MEAWEDLQSLAWQQPATGQVKASAAASAAAAAAPAMAPPAASTAAAGDVAAPGSSVLQRMRRRREMEAEVGEGGSFLFILHRVVWFACNCDQHSFIHLLTLPCVSVSVPLVTMMTAAAPAGGVAGSASSGGGGRGGGGAAAAAGAGAGGGKDRKIEMVLGPVTCACTH